MRFGSIAHAEQSILATRVTATSSQISGPPFIRPGGHQLSRMVYGAMSLCTFLIAALMVKLLKGHDLGTIHGQSFDLKTCTIAARKRCHYPALCRLNLFSMMMMRYEAGSVAGDRSEGNFSMKLAAQFCGPTPQSWKQMPLAKMLIPWMSNCWSGFDLAQL